MGANGPPEYPDFSRLSVSVEQMKVGAADGAGRDLNDCVAGMLDLRIRNRVYPDVAFSAPA